MAEPESTSSNKLYTLSEISQKTGISMPTLQRYKKLYQSRIPATGKGRKQRYPEESLPVFEELKVENAGRRGRPRKDDSTRSSAAASAANAASTGSARSGRGRKAAAAKTPAAGRRGGRKAAAPAAAAKTAKKSGRGGRKAAAAAPAASGRGGRNSGLLTLTQVSEQTGISYPTLVRYVRVHSSRLPSEGSGRARRFHPEAVDVFRQLREESGRGGRKPAAAKAAAGRGRGRAAKGSARGGRPAAAAAANTAGSDPGTSQRLRALERAQQDLEKRFRGFVSSLQKLFR